MALSSIDTSDLQDAYLNDSAKNIYGRHGMSKNARFYIPVGINSVDMFNSAGVSADTAADCADSYAKDAIGCVNNFDRHGVGGVRRKTATMNGGRNVNTIIH